MSVDFPAFSTPASPQHTPLRTFPRLFSGGLSVIRWSPPDILWRTNSGCSACSKMSYPVTSAVKHKPRHVSITQTMKADSTPLFLPHTVGRTESRPCASPWRRNLFEKKDSHIFIYPGRPPSSDFTCHSLYSRVSDKTASPARDYMYAFVYADTR